MEELINEPLVSIIVPVYNTEHYLLRCFDSLLMQSYKNLEIIAVDDGSRDGSHSVLQQIAKSDSRVRLLTKSNEGLPRARMSGLGKANGAFLLFVDSDDWIEPETVEVMVARALEANVDFVSCDVRFVYEDGRKSEWVNGDGEDYVFTREEALEAIYERRTVFQYVANKLFRKESVMPIDFIDAANSMGEDYQTILRIIERVNKVSHIGRPLYNYLQRNSSMSQEGFTEKHRQAYRSFLAAEKRELGLYPRLWSIISAYTSVELLWIVLPMARNGCYDTTIIREVQNRFRRDFKNVMSYRGVGKFEKGAVFLFSINPGVFFQLYYPVRYRQKLPVPLVSSKR